MGAAALFCLWAVLFWGTWGHWGNVTIDCGREMYVPAALLEGKTLYSDVWYLYGPAAPYFNRMLFGVFGTHLNVLYWAGALSALGCAGFLLLTGMRLGALAAGWAAGAIVLMQSFAPWLFSFPLGYSFAATYACLMSCLLLWLMVNAAVRPGWGWMFGAGCTAAVALVLKLEYGVASYGTLALLVVGRALRRRTVRGVVLDLLAMAPGALGALAVIVWMVSLGGVEFLTQENLMSWPSSWFMRRYGAVWMRIAGFSWDAGALTLAMVHLAGVVVCALVLGSVLRWLRRGKRPAGRDAVVAALGAMGLLIVTVRYHEVLHAVFFPRPMALLVALAALPAAYLFWRSGFGGEMLAVLTLLAFSAVLAFRVFLGMAPQGYAIYYNGPAVLAFLMLVRWAVARPEREGGDAVPGGGELVLTACVVVTVVLFLAPYYWMARNWAPLVTERGTVYLEPAKVASYRAAIDFMRVQARAGKATLTIPEDVSLYFFSATMCPTRVFALTPGVLAPGKMTDSYLAEVERQRVEYLIWSNRTFEEYEATEFGVDFDVPVGEYLRARYRPLESLPGGTGRKDWAARIWQRKAEDAVR